MLRNLEQAKTAAQNAADTYGATFYAFENKAIGGFGICQGEPHPHNCPNPVKCEPQPAEIGTVTFPMQGAEDSKPVRGLSCSCCGTWARGRQWLNRDTGYGLCAECGVRLLPKLGAEEMRSLYGVRGVHYDVRENEPTPNSDGPSDATPTPQQAENRADKISQSAEIPAALFGKTPCEILDKAGTLALLANPGEWLSRRDKWEVKSQYICDFLDELEKSGYVYNAQALRKFEAAHDLPTFDENGSVLSLLIYNAQHFRRNDQLVRDGWLPGGAEMLKQAYDSKAKIQIQGENFIGANVQELLNVREIDGKLFAMRPNKRKYAVNIEGQPCKIIGGKTTPPTSDDTNNGGESDPQQAATEESKNCEAPKVCEVVTAAHSEEIPDDLPLDPAPEITATQGEIPAAPDAAEVAQMAVQLPLSFETGVVFGEPVEIIQCGTWVKPHDAPQDWAPVFSDNYTYTRRPIIEVNQSTPPQVPQKHITKNITARIFLQGKKFAADIECDGHAIGKHIKPGALATVRAAATRYLESITEFVWARFTVNIAWEVPEVAAKPTRKQAAKVEAPKLDAADALADKIREWSRKHGVKIEDILSGELPATHGEIVTALIEDKSLQSPETAPASVPDLAAQALALRERLNARCEALESIQSHDEFMSCEERRARLRHLCCLAIYRWERRTRLTTPADKRAHSAMMQRERVKYQKRHPRHLLEQELQEAVPVIVPINEESPAIEVPQEAAQAVKCEAQKPKITLPPYFDKTPRTGINRAILSAPQPPKMPTIEEYANIVYPADVVTVRISYNHHFFEARRAAIEAAGKSFNGAPHWDSFGPNGYEYGAQFADFHDSSELRAAVKATKTARVCRERPCTKQQARYSEFCAEWQAAHTAQPIAPRRPMFSGSPASRMTASPMPCPPYPIAGSPTARPGFTRNAFTLVQADIRGDKFLQKPDNAPRTGINRAQTPCGASSMPSTALLVSLTGTAHHSSPIPRCKGSPCSRSL